MKYLNMEVLNKVDATKYRNKEPYPFMEIPNALTKEGYRKLIETRPPISRFTKDFGRKRAYGQKVCDRWELIYTPELKNVPKPWKEFIAELQSKEYKDWLAKMFGTNKFTIRYHWHYASTNNSICPHCDGISKVASHIFYLNTKKDWKPEWGGNTLSLIDKDKKKHWQSAPEIEDFDEVIKSNPIGNNSFIFTRTNHSWHAMDKLKCPEGKYRMVFIAVIDKKVSWIGHKVWVAGNILRKVTGKNKPVLAEN